MAVVVSSAFRNSLKCVGDFLRKFQAVLQGVPFTGGASFNVEKAHFTA